MTTITCRFEGGPLDGQEGKLTTASPALHGEDFTYRRFAVSYVDNVAWYRYDPNAED